MNIQVNGKPQTLDPEQTLADLLLRLELDPQRVVVERNREIVRRSEFPAVRLEEGDALEILHFVGGG